MALAAKHRLNPHVTLGLGHRAVKVGTHAGVGLEVAVNHLLGLAARNVKRRGKAVGLLAIDDAKVHGLGSAAELGRHLGDGHAKHASGRLGVEILALAEGRDEMLVA